MPFDAEAWLAAVVSAVETQNLPGAVRLLGVSPCDGYVNERWEAAQRMLELPIVRMALTDRARHAMRASLTGRVEREPRIAALHDRLLSCIASAPAAVDETAAWALTAPREYGRWPDREGSMVRVTAHAIRSWSYGAALDAATRRFVGDRSAGALRAAAHHALRAIEEAGRQTGTHDVVRGYLVGRREIQLSVMPPGGYIEPMVAGDGVDGDSIGLAAAMATIAELLGFALPSDVAFTGAIGGTGVLEYVEALEQKLAAAVDFGIERVVVPSGSTLPTTHGLHIEPCETLVDAANRIFGAERMVRGAHALLAKLAIEPETRAPSRVPVSASAARLAAIRARGHAVLFSFVGRSDPTGSPRSPSGRHLRDGDGTRWEEWGAVLAAAEAVLPRRAVLLYTTDDRGENDFSTNAKETANSLRRLGIEDVELVPVTLDSPNDPFEVLRRLRATLDPRLAALRESGGEAIASVTSGTPQMFWAWMELARLVDTLVTVQVTESRFVRHDRGESRVHVLTRTD